jgi:hypothetical protein
MSGIEHAACGYSEFAPGCDDWECLVHRIDVAFARGWDSDGLRVRLEASLASAVDDALRAMPTAEPVDLTDPRTG